MVAKVILNPYSNRWKSQARWPEAEAALKAAGVEFELAVSQRKGHVVELAEEAARAGFSPIIAAGGDGTIGETVNGMARAATSDKSPLGPFGIMPLGSANDFVFNANMSEDFKVAAQVIAAGKTRAIDLGVLNGRFFINNSAAGLEPYVTTKHERIQWIKGMVRYLVAAVWAIMDKPEWNGEVKWDDGEYNGPLSLVSVGNGRRTGGFFMTPHADLTDGKLTLAFGYRGTRLGLFQALPRAFNEGKGNYVEMEGMYEVHSKKVNIHLDHPSPAHTDGELFPDYVQDFDYSIQPGRLQLLVPQKP
ncbi:MAG: diacylglycerol kinase family lipid kinase [Anaerolineales bacterium]|nr:diacylglycerol kinase family lipid kinase [Anaerolineales bacterium]